MNKMTQKDVVSDYLKKMWLYRNQCCNNKRKTVGGYIWKFK